MSNIFNYILIGLLPVLPVKAQKEDPAGRQIMNDFTQVTQSYPGISTSFLFTTIDLKDKSENSYSGSLKLKGEMYFLKLDNMEIYYDGTTLWNYLPDEQEVNISTPDNNPDESSDFDNPARLFSLLSKGFFTKFIDSDTREGKTVQVIDLYPKDLHKPYSRIRLQIFKEDNRLYSAHYFGKDGMHYILKLTNFSTGILPDSIFHFDPVQHPDVEIIDLR